MMRKIKILFLLASAMFMTSTFAQNDAKAKKFLDEVSAKTKTYKTIVSEFVLKVDNKKTNVHETQQGKIFIKGVKYKLEVANQVIVNDNKTVWTVIKDAEEIQINNADDKNKKEDAITPSNIFTVYEKNFKYEFWKEEKDKKGATKVLIKLFPTDTKGKNYHTIILTIDKASKQINSMKILGKDGVETTYILRNFRTNDLLDDNIFTLNTKSYPKYEIVDLR
jgi:outer membrane lipoprotein-sorting protein